MDPCSEKIIAMDIWHCQLPVNSRRDHGIGTVSDKIDVVIVALQSESGATGYGEASPWSVFTGTAESNLAALHRYMRPHVIGRPVSDIHRILRTTSTCVVHDTEAKAALETALLDLQGQLLGVSVATLLGGAVRDTIPLSVSLANPDFAADLELVRELNDAGVRIVKFKTGIQGHAFDLQRLERMRTDYPDFDIRVDYNQGLAPTDALRKLRDIENFNVTFIEQPVKVHEYRIMQQLTSALDTPLLADESVFHPADMLRAVEDKLCNAVSVKIMKCGGLRSGQIIASIAEAAGMAAYGGDMFETGLAHLAGTHMIAASANISLGCEFYQASYYLREDLLCEPFPIVDGAVCVPTGPGLGISVDPQRLERYAVVHLSA